MSLQMLVPQHEILTSFTASSGPGGQNVNKTATKVQLRWHVLSSNAFSESQKHTIAFRLGDRITQDGWVIIDVSETRSQAQNKQIALDKLQALVAEALIPVIPRRTTRIPKRVKLDRLKEKRQRSSLKESRKPVAED